MERGAFSRRQFLSSGAAGLGALVVGSGTAGANASGRHLVGTSSPAARRRAEHAAESVYRVLDFGAIGQVVAGQFDDEALAALEQNPNVRYIEADGTMEALGQTLPWGIDRVDAEVAHANGETGGDDGGADIAIIDTGIDSDHPDLQANVGTGKAFVECKGGPKDCRKAWDDDEGHGTHCAGIADAVDNTEGVVGVSTEATLHAVKVLDNSGSGSFSDVAAGIEWTADQGYEVGSMSLGASSGSQTVKDACQYAHDKGVLLVAAAGNSGPCTDCVGYPAAYSTVVAVSATDPDDSLADYSSTGSEVEIAAPGTDVYSTYEGGGYSTLSGTSMACPHVSGTGGQLMDNDYTNKGARDQLTSTAEDLGLASNEQGAGLLDVEAAVSGSVDTSPSVSWINPAGGDTVSGTITIQIDASDTEDSDDSLDVTYTVDSGSTRSTTYNSTSGFYEDSWDSTGVSDGDHNLAATATDSAGNTSSASITVTTDNTEDAPAVDSLSATEVETSDSDAEFDVDWSVSDSDGNLSSVDLTLTDDIDSESEDTATVSVSGETASGTSRLVAAGDDGSGNSYAVEATVTDDAGNSDSATTFVSETEDTSGGNAPTVDSISLSEDNSGGSPHANFDASWTVSDGDGDLNTADLTLTDLDDGETEDSTSIDVSGGDASGTTALKAKHDENNGNTYEVELVVTDSNSNTASGTATETENGD